MCWWSINKTFNDNFARLNAYFYSFFSDLNERKKQPEKTKRHCLNLFHTQRMWKEQLPWASKTFWPKKKPKFKSKNIVFRFIWIRSLQSYSTYIFTAYSFFAFSYFETIISTITFCRIFNFIMNWVEFVSCLSFQL